MDITKGRKIKNLDDIYREKEIAERKENIEKNASDWNALVERITQQRTEINKRYKKNRTLLQKVSLGILIFITTIFAANFLLLNIWALKTLVQSIAGWFK